ncbi:MAG: hemerythrin domain-containing protein [Burkholderiaceae bacterium]|nr:hemerythrin domain-containing protein [Burkholderiaceae bacterium]
MNLPFPGHNAPSAGFEVPLEMLAACHHRVERQCQTLQRLVKHLTTHELDEDARVAAAAVLRYFDTAAKHHHADEETDLFPALLESVAGSDPIRIRELVESLIADHRTIEVQWRILRPKLAAIAAGEALVLAAADVDPLIALYEQHIAREEAELLPMAARLLSDSTLDVIGRAMRVRRGIGDDD